jgi:glucose-1-phosphatase
MCAIELQAILFDFGGVLVEWDGIQPLLDLTEGRLSADEARLFWLNSPAVRKFETGRCLQDEFARGAIEELQADLTPSEFIAEFTSWDRGLLPGARELVADLKTRVTLHCLSNNNPIHWDLPHLQDLASDFSQTFVSFEMGLMKPDVAAFEYAAARIPEPVERVLFLDDNPECVQAAMRVGFLARSVRGVAEVKGVLGEFGGLA